MPVLTIGVLLSCGPGVCLALRAQREREVVKLQPARPTSTTREVLLLFPHLPSLILIFLGFSITMFTPRHCPNPQPGSSYPPRAALLKDVPAHPTILIWTAQIKRQGGQQSHFCTL